MKYADLIKPLGVRTEDAGVMIGNTALFERMVQAGWIKAVVNTRCCRLFDRNDVEKCWNRLKEGDYP